MICKNELGLVIYSCPECLIKGIIMSNGTWYMTLGVLNIPLYFFVGKIIFTDWENFWSAVGYWFKPDMWSFMRGEGLKDFVAEMKLSFFFIICVGTVYGEFYLISKYLF